MNSSHIINFMMECGAGFSDHDFPVVYNYINRMLEDDRVLIIFSPDNIIQGILFYSVCDEYEVGVLPCYGIWQYHAHNETGNIIYVDKLIAKLWNMEIRNQVRNILSIKHPNFEFAVWHRDRNGTEKLVKYRRSNHVSS